MGACVSVSCCAVVVLRCGLRCGCRVRGSATWCFADPRGRACRPARPAAAGGPHRVGRTAAVHRSWRARRPVRGTGVASSARARARGNPRHDGRDYPAHRAQVKSACTAASRRRARRQARREARHRPARRRGRPRRSPSAVRPSVIQADDLCPPCTWPSPLSAPPDGVDLALGAAGQRQRDDRRDDAQAARDETGTSDDDRRGPHRGRLAGASARRSVPCAGGSSRLLPAYPALRRSPAAARSSAAGRSRGCRRTPAAAVAGCGPYPGGCRSPPRLPGRGRSRRTPRLGRTVAPSAVGQWLAPRGGPQRLGHVGWSPPRRLPEPSTGRPAASPARGQASGSRLATRRPADAHQCRTPVPDGRRSRGSAGARRVMRTQPLGADGLRSESTSR